MTLTRSSRDRQAASRTLGEMPTDHGEVLLRATLGSDGHYLSTIEAARRHGVSIDQRRARVRVELTCGVDLTPGTVKAMWRGSDRHGCLAASPSFRAVCRPRRRFYSSTR